MYIAKDDYDSMLFEATYVLLVVLRKPWICTLCFDAHFSKFSVIFFWFWTIFNRKMDILDHFLGPQTASLQKSRYICLYPNGPLLKPAKTPLNPILTILDPLRVLDGGWWLGPARADFGLEDLLRASQTHAWDLKFWSFWPLFLLKSQFCHFAYQGSVKMPFWPYFDPFWAPPEPKPLAPWPKMCLFRPTARMDLEGPLGTLIWP